MPVTICYWSSPQEMMALMDAQTSSKQQQQRPAPPSCPVGAAADVGRGAGAGAVAAGAQLDPLDLSKLAADLASARQVATGTA